jgi:CrcB protein
MLGCSLRYATSLLLTTGSPGGFPWSTFTVNLVGCFVMGWAARFMLGPGGPAEPWRLAVLVGFLGGLTTFSSLAWEVFALAQAQRALTAGIYWIASNVLGVALLAAGWHLAGPFKG